LIKEKNILLVCYKIKKFVIPNHQLAVKESHNLIFRRTLKYFIGRENLSHFITRNDTSYLRLLQFLPEHLAIIIHQNNDWVMLQLQPGLFFDVNKTNG